MQCIARTHVCRISSNTLLVPYLKGMQPGPSPMSFHAHVPLHNCTLHTSGCTTPLKSARAKPPSPSAPRAGRILRPDLARQPQRANRTVRQANPFPVMTLCPQRISLHRAQGESRRGADPGPSARQGGPQARIIPRSRPPQRKVAPDRDDPEPLCRGETANGWPLQLGGASFLPTAFLQS